jgi:TonB family protein
MNQSKSTNRYSNFGLSRKKLVQSAALAMMLVMALPAMAADARAVKSRVSPVYPEIAKRMRISGSVKLEAAVDSQGKVTDVKEVSGNHTLAEAAKEALMKWKFAAASSDSNETVEINFDLAN